jgi:hypothetical protein
LGPVAAAAAGAGEAFDLLNQLVTVAVSAAAFELKFSLVLIRK